MSEDERKLLIFCARMLLRECQGVEEEEDLKAFIESVKRMTNEDH